MRDRIGNAKLSMEQIKLRLSTVSELGDIVVTLSPCMSLIKGLAPSISTLMPQMHSSMENLTSTLGDMITDSSLTQESMTPTYQEMKKQKQYSRKHMMFLKVEHLVACQNLQQHY